MQLKLFELRDKGTFIPIFAFRCRSDIAAGLPQRIAREFAGDEAAEPFWAAGWRQDWLLKRAGYGDQQDGLVMVGSLAGGHCHYDAFSFGSARTYQTAVAYIQENWDELDDGAVICVEFILGERDEPKPSEAG